MSQLSYNNLAQKILTPQGLSMLYGSSITRRLDFEGALRRAVIILSIYHENNRDLTENENQSFTVSSWKNAFNSEKWKMKNYEKMTIIEIFNHLTSIGDLSTLIYQLGNDLKVKKIEIDIATSFIPFKAAYRTISTDFADLSNGKEIKPWLTVSKQENTNYYQRLDISKLPIFAEDCGSTATEGITIDRQTAKILGEYLDILTFIDPELAVIANLLSDAQNPHRRVQMHLDYVVSEEDDRLADIADRMDKCHNFLRSVWEQATPTFISFNYYSANSEREKKCLVYPVCIYYFQRAKYLCAWGKQPPREVTWSNYRLDRIQVESLQIVPGDSPDIPDDMKEAKKLNRLPTPVDIQEQMKLAWGFEFHQPAETLILRFERQYHDKYIANTFRHETFELIPTLDGVKDLLKQQPYTDPSLLARIDLHSQDAYYQAQVRLNDFNIMMRLRAWGDKVEVLSPNLLRQQMISTLQNSLNNYHK